MLFNLNDVEYSMFRALEHKNEGPYLDLFTTKAKWVFWYCVFSDDRAVQSDDLSRVSQKSEQILKMRLKMPSYLELYEKK